MNLETAVQEHASWKLKFRHAISRKEQMDAAKISRDDCCSLGQWLYAEGKSRFGNRPEFQKALDKHKAFHAQAGRVANLINTGNYTEAEAAIASGTPYAIASNEVAVALTSLRKIVAD